jgi:hypothetical protein
VQSRRKDNNSANAVDNDSRLAPLRKTIVQSVRISDTFLSRKDNVRPPNRAADKNFHRHLHGVTTQAYYRYGNESFNLSRTLNLRTAASHLQLR